MTRCLLFVVCLLASCQHRDNDGRASTPSPTVAPKPAPADPAPAPSDGISGRVVETMDAAGYTYAKLDRNGTEIWIAGPKTTLAIGTQLAGLEGQLMADFHSNTLDRTFAQIYFVSGFGAGAAAVANPHPAPAPAVAAPAADAGDAVSGTVVATMDGGGYTYAQLDQDGTKVWVAGPATKLAVGTKVGRMTGTLMTGFKSSTLNRTFDQIYFVGTYAVDPARTN
jgi:hypothetical protein